MSEKGKFMREALNLAKNGEGKVNPNPLVGAVVVKDGQIIGRGYHKEYGGPHAEIFALDEAGEKARGADLYVTLEPCVHQGKTPPCVNKIIKSGIKKVYISSKDPFGQVNRRGMAKLQEAGIEVKEGILKEQAKKLNEVYFKYVTTGRPFIVLKMAMTLDGKIATKTGDSKWISGKEARRMVHSLRNKYSGVLVGINTVLRDDPRLNVRWVEGVDPMRIVLDSEGKIPLGSKIINQKSSAQTVVATTDRISEEKLTALQNKGVTVWKLGEKNGKVDLNLLIKRLSQRDIDSVMVEGGSTVASSFIKERLVDKVLFFIAPSIIGGKRAISPVGGKGVESLKDAFKLTNVSTQTLANGDLLYEGYLDYGRTRRISRRNRKRPKL